MADIYTVTLSDGVTNFLIYPLEANGPDNESIPRQICTINAGGAGSGSFELNGDLTYRFVAGFTFTVGGTAGSPGINNGTYTVKAGGSTFLGPAGSPCTNTTLIPVDEAVSVPGLPLGTIQYSVPDSENATSLTLPGRGYINYGMLHTNSFVHLLENFASPTPPPNPLPGQHWFNPVTGIMHVFNGGSPIVWTAEGISIYEEGILVQSSVRDIDFVGPNITATQKGGSPANDDIQVTVNAGGADTNVQYNSSGEIVGVAGFTFDGTNLSVGGEVRGTTLVASIEYLFTERADHNFVAAASRGILWLRDDSALVFTDGAGTDHNLLQPTFFHPDYTAQMGSDGAGSPQVYTTPFSFTTPAAGKTALQVFVNGVKQKEATGGSPSDGAYVATAPNSITFEPGSQPSTLDDVEFYGFG